MLVIERLTATHSNSVLHRCCSLPLHETPHPQLENSARFAALRSSDQQRLGRDGGGENG